MSVMKSVFLFYFLPVAFCHAGEGRQVVKIVKENADCAHAVYVTDSVVFCPDSPRGAGNILEIKDNAADDPLHFEMEHNTVWYKYVVPENGQLTFDLVPEDANDDYDFMLYKWEGGDLGAKIMTKQAEPLRSCISRNDESIKGMTGLKTDCELPNYIHSGKGGSYVRHLDVSKGDVYYLLVDNVYANGNGHTLRFHMKAVAPGELYVGKMIPFEHITFKDSDDEFKKGSEKDLDSLYRFLVQHPNLKVEIQGHTNVTGSNHPVRIHGKPPYTSFQLSQRRAVVIAEYLIKRGIAAERIRTRGYGSTRKKVEHPKTIRENIMNVRAEVMIISLDYKPASGN
ncbi:MAG: hypothetical protein JWO09_3128 [Bacteroidetes bacterium]|nr:hypothetical protein [Bacteroidota bacterium]